MMKRLSHAVLALAILAAAGLGAYWLWHTRSRVQATPPAERVRTVAAVPALRVDAQTEMRVFGDIVAGREVELRPLVAGRVVEVGADFVEGGVVRAGALLVAIDRFEYRAAIAEYEARIAEARAKLAEIGAQLTSASELLERDREQRELGRRDVDRRDRLRGTPAGSEKALDDARLVLSQRQQQVIVRQETMDRLAAQAEQQEAVIERWQVALRRARRDLEQTRLTAPFDGFLVDTDAAVGKRLGVGDRVARLIGAGRLEARFHLSDTQFARLLAAGGYRGRPASLAWRVAGETFRFDAVIDRIEGEFDPLSGGVDLYARIEDMGVDGVLRPGAFVEVRVPEKAYSDVVRLPESALYDRDTVYTVIDQRLTPRKVEVVSRGGGEILVRGELRAEDMVVTTPLANVDPSLRVVVR